MKLQTIFHEAAGLLATQPENHISLCASIAVWGMTTPFVH